MTFAKGHKINIGRSHSSEAREKISRAHKGMKKPWVTGQSARGRVQSVEERQMRSKAQLGIKRGPMSEQGRKNISLAHLGQKPWNKGLTKKTDTRIKAYAEKISGENAHNWRGGVTPINKKIRKSLEYKIWREAVFARDNYTCQFCRIRGGVLHPDHIKPFSSHPDLRFELSNGRTLCASCHRKTDTWGFSQVHKTRAEDVRKLYLSPAKGSF